MTRQIATALSIYDRYWRKMMQRQARRLADLADMLPAQVEVAPHTSPGAGSATAEPRAGSAGGPPPRAVSATAVVRAGSAVKKAKAKPGSKGWGITNCIATFTTCTHPHQPKLGLRC